MTSVTASEPRRFVDRGDHLWTRRSKRIHVVPLTDQTVGLLSRLDDADPTMAWPLAPNPLVSVEKLLIAPGLHAEAHGIESNHRTLLPLVNKQDCIT
jgi:hypothetical protein